MSNTTPTHNATTPVPRRFTAAWLLYHTDFLTSPDAKLNMYALGAGNCLASASASSLYQPTEGMAWEVDRMQALRGAKTLGIKGACRIVEAAIEKRKRDKRQAGVEKENEQVRVAVEKKLRSQIKSISTPVELTTPVRDIEPPRTDLVKQDEARPWTEDGKVMGYRLRNVFKLDQQAEAAARRIRHQTYVEVGNGTPKPSQDKRRDRIERNAKAFGFKKGNFTPLK